MSRYKKGANSGYRSLAQIREDEESKGRKSRLGNHDRSISHSHKFRGFIGGSQFRTSLGFQGNAFDSLWVKHVFESFRKDDEELFQTAMKSSLADINDKVIGGEYGTPYSIGSFGFYGLNQFQDRSNFISQYERKEAVGKYFLSSTEWDEIDDKILRNISVASYKTRRAIRGDSFASLALRANAYKVARCMLDLGLDPLVENEDGEDLESILKEQYNTLCEEMHHILEEKESFAQSVVIPSQQRDVTNREDELLRHFYDMRKFLEFLLQQLEKRLINILDDKMKKRKLELQGHLVPNEILWNINQEGKTQEHIKESQSLFKLIDDRIKVYERQREVHVDMTELMMKQHKTITKKQSREKKGTDHEQDDTLGFDTAQKAALILEKEKLRKIHGMETAEEKRKRIEASEAEAEELRQLEEALKEVEISDESDKKNGLNIDTLEPILGILVKTEYEQMAYR
jgi:hypothetical protein